LREYRATGVSLSNRYSHRRRVDQVLSIETQIRRLNMRIAAAFATVRSRDDANMSASKSPSAHVTPTNAGRPPFDSVTICLHWATVLLVLAMFASALLRAQAQDDVLKAVLLQIHRSLGLTIWVTTGFRLACWLSHAKLPPFPADMTKVHRATAYLSEYGLYALLPAQPATGLGATLLGGRPFALFLWRFSQLGPQDKVL
jgi:cytochrome b561